VLFIFQLGYLNFFYWAMFNKNNNKHGISGLVDSNLDTVLIIGPFLQNIEVMHSVYLVIFFLQCNYAIKIYIDIRTVHRRKKRGVNVNIGRDFSAGS
jgi:hypothetical protein